MARSFLGFGQVPYIGQTFSLPMKFGGIAGVIVPLLLQWLAYGASTAKPNINVLVSLDNPQCKALDQIRSIYIDNLGSDNPIYIYFPDTGCTLAAKPNSEGWYPAYTNSRHIWIIGEGFLTGDIPQTLVQVSNVPMPASVNTEIDNAVSLWRASPTITRGNTIYNAALGIPALGDQLFSSQALDLTTTGNVALWGTPYASGFVYITDMQVIVTDASTTNPFLASLNVESTGVGGVLITPRFLSPSSASGYAQINAAFNIFSLKGNIKLDATQTWRMRNLTAILSGSAVLYASFTQQP